jgi:hypothetical protein
MYDVTNRGTVDVKWRVLEFGHLLSSAVKCRGLPHNRNNFLANSSQVDCGLPRSGCRGQVKPVAIRSQIHTSVCGNPHDGYSILGNPRSKRRGLPQSAHTFERGTWQEPELEFKIPTRRIV